MYHLVNTAACLWLAPEGIINSVVSVLIIDMMYQNSSFEFLLISLEIKVSTPSGKIDWFDLSFKFLQVNELIIYTMLNVFVRKSRLLSSKHSLVMLETNEYRLSGCLHIDIVKYKLRITIWRFFVEWAQWTGWKGLCIVLSNLYFTV